MNPQSSNTNTSNNTSNIQVLTSSPWQSDDTKQCCTSCNSRFNNLFNRKHHCRLCGDIFCHTCTQQRSLIPPSSIVLQPTGGKKVKAHERRRRTQTAMGGDADADDPDRVVTFAQNVNQQQEQTNRVGTATGIHVFNHDAPNIPHGNSGTSTIASESIRGQGFEDDSINDDDSNNSNYDDEYGLSFADGASFNTFNQNSLFSHALTESQEPNIITQDEQVANADIVAKQQDLQEVVLEEQKNGEDDEENKQDHNTIGFGNGLQPPSTSLRTITSTFYTENRTNNNSSTNNQNENEKQNNDPTTTANNYRNNKKNILCDDDLSMSAATSTDLSYITLSNHTQTHQRRQQQQQLLQQQRPPNILESLSSSSLSTTSNSSSYDYEAQHQLHQLNQLHQQATVLYGKGLEERMKLAREPLRVCRTCYTKLESIQEGLCIHNSNAMKYNTIDPTNIRRLLNSPLAFTLGHEIRKAAYTLNNLLPLPRKMGIFVETANYTRSSTDCAPVDPKDACKGLVGNFGNVDGVRIPAKLLEKAKGVAVMTCIKSGIGFTGIEFGTGLVVSKLDDNQWSPPVAIGTCSVSWGALVGVSLSDHVFLLMTDKAVDIMSCNDGSFQLGADIGVAVGPLGRSFEANIGKIDGDFAPIYTYSLSKGFYAGVSFDGKVMVTRHRVNEKFYGRQIDPRALLNGDIPTPPAAQPLYDALKRCHVYATTTGRTSASSRIANNTSSRSTMQRPQIPHMHVSASSRYYNNTIGTDAVIPEEEFEEEYNINGRDHLSPFY